MGFYLETPEYISPMFRADWLRCEGAEFAMRHSTPRGEFARTIFPPNKGEILICAIHNSSHVALAIAGTEREVYGLLEMDCGRDRIWVTVKRDWLQRHTPYDLDEIAPEFFDPDIWHDDDPRPLED